MSSIPPTQRKSKIDVDQIIGLVAYLNDRYTKSEIDALINNIPKKVTVKQFGAIGNGINDDTQAIQDAINYCSQNNLKLYVPGGLYLLTSTINITEEISIEGEDPSFDTMFRFIGEGQKVVRTKVKHPDDGSDDPISVGILITGAATQIKNIIVDLYCDYTNLSANNYGSNYDVGILVQAPSVKLEKTRARGYWREAGIWIDNTRDRGNCDGITLEDVRTQGKWSLKIKGPNIKIGQNELDNTTDLRGSGGISDFIATNCYFDGFNHHSGVRPSDVDGGCLWIDGAADPGIAGTDAIQGHRFIGCRFYSFDPYAIKLNKTIRDLFIGCFIERYVGKFKTDGVSPVNQADVQVYSQPVGASGGTKALRLIGTDLYRITDNFTRANGFYLEQMINENMQLKNNIAYGLHEFPQSILIGSNDDSNLRWGVFTPVGLGITNVSSISISTNSMNYMRVGNTIMFGGSVTITPSAASEVLFELSLPITSDFTTSLQANGTMTSQTPSTNISGAIYSAATNNALRLRFVATSTTAIQFRFNGIYTII